jgi:methylisocitrate lyase
VPRAHDAISAKLIEQAGFKALQVSGFGLSATYLGLPDMAFIGFSDVVHFTKNIVDAVKVPVMADADTGYGNSINAMYVTREFIQAGAAGMNIEAQVFPKRCGHLEGKQIIPMEEMVLKIKACKAVKDEIDPDFVLNARTDAIAVAGIEEAIRRPMPTPRPGGPDFRGGAPFRGAGRAGGEGDQGPREHQPHGRRFRRENAPGLN